MILDGVWCHSVRTLGLSREGGKNEAENFTNGLESEWKCSYVIAYDKHKIFNSKHITFFLADNQQWLFTGILPNLYHPPETLALKSDVVGSLLVSEDQTMRLDERWQYHCFLSYCRDQKIRTPSQNHLVPTANAFWKSCESRLATS